MTRIDLFQGMLGLAAIIMAIGAAGAWVGYHYAPRRYQETEIAAGVGGGIALLLAALVTAALMPIGGGC